MVRPPTLCRELAQGLGAVIAGVGDGAGTLKLAFRRVVGIGPQGRAQAFQGAFRGAGVGGAA